MIRNWQRRQALWWKHRRAWYLQPAVTVYPPRSVVDSLIGYASAVLGGVLITLLVLGLL